MYELELRGNEHRMKSRDRMGQFLHGLGKCTASVGFVLECKDRPHASKSSAAFICKLRGSQHPPPPPHIHLLPLQTKMCPLLHFQDLPLAYPVYFTLFVSQSHLAACSLCLIFHCSTGGLAPAVNVQDPSHLRKEGGPREKQDVFPSCPSSPM